MAAYVSHLGTTSIRQYTGFNDKSSKDNSNEEFWQVIFNENPYVLSQLFSVPVIFIKDKAYVGGMNIDHQDAKFVDYLYTNESSHDALLVEIKTPATKLVGSKYRKGVYKPSSDLSGSVGIQANHSFDIHFRISLAVFRHKNTLDGVCSPMYTCIATKSHPGHKWRRA